MSVHLIHDLSQEQLIVPFKPARAVCGLEIAEAHEVAVRSGVDVVLVLPRAPRGDRVGEPRGHGVGRGGGRQRELGCAPAQRERRVAGEDGACRRALDVRGHTRPQAELVGAAEGAEAVFSAAQR